MSRQRGTAQRSGSEPGSARPASAVAKPDFRRGAPILKLQRTIGNKAVQRLVQVQQADSEVMQDDRNLSAHLDNGMNSPAHPLDDASREFMEQSFGVDFSEVRLHTDAAAERSAQAFNANAYTVGQDIVFAAGKYAPGTSEGKRLLAHELTHVIQQPSVSDTSEEFAISHPGQESELEAEQIASQVVSSAGMGANADGSLSEGAIKAGTDHAIAPTTVSRDDNSDEEPPNPVSTVGMGVDIAEGMGAEAAEGLGQVFGPAQLLLGAQDIGNAKDPVGAMQGGAEVASGVGNTAALLGLAGEGSALADLGPLGAAAGGGMALGAGMGALADSSLTKTGAFGTDESGQNQSAMDWGSNWGTWVDKKLGNTDPSVLGGIAAGAGGIVGGIGGALYGAGNLLFGDDKDDGS
jgi:hypothetical protein